MSKSTESTVWDDARLADVHGQPDKASRVQAMFDAIAPSYERVNKTLSAGRDRYWRRRAVALAKVEPQERILDLGCGTGDFARAFASASPAAVVGCDFSQQMLQRAAKSNQLPISWCRGDALSLPFVDRSFSVVACAFSVRNFQDLSQGLGEAFRVLAPGGRVVILEFSMPRTPLLGSLYLAYFRWVLPRLATLFSGDRSGAYHYLPASVSSFTNAAGMTEQLHAAGFGRVEAHTLTLGVVTIFIARKDD